MARPGRFKWLALLAGGGLLPAAGNCLPEDYFATLAGDTLSGVVGTIVNAIVESLLNSPPA